MSAQQSKLSPIMERTIQHATTAPTLLAACEAALESLGEPGDLIKQIRAIAYCHGAIAVAKSRGVEATNLSGLVPNV